MPHIKNAFIRYRIIDRMIRNRYKPFPSKQEMREACEDALYGDSHGNHICDSTIEKDMFAMRMEHDAPIRYSKSKGGYYYEDPDFSINDIPLSEDELNSIKFALNTLQQFREVPFFQQFGSAIDKIVNRVSVETTTEDAHRFIQFESSASVQGSEFLPVLLEAIQAQKKVWFLYASFVTQEEKPRKVSPLLLKEYRNRWYLVSYDASKKDIITFGLDRMKDLMATEDSAEVPSDFSSDRYFQHTVGITAYKGEPSLVRIKAQPVAARYIDSQPFHPSQRMISEKEIFIFELNILISEEFIRALLGFAGEVEVLAPESLRNEIRQRAQVMFANYR